MIRSRRGVSLLELLVVLSVLSFLVSLLLPAIQKTRAAANRLSCQSNLRQIGLATLNYESTLGRLPPALEHPAPGVNTPQLLWTIHISPYLELEASWRMAEEDYRRSKDPILPTPHRGLSIPLKPYSCPSDPRTTQAWDQTFYYSLAKPVPQLVKIRAALNSYLGNAGTVTQQRNGVILADGRLTMLSIVDGTSQTLAFGERPPPVKLLYARLYVGWGALGPKGDGEFDAVMGVRDLYPFGRFNPPPSVCEPGPYPYRQPVLDSKNDCAMFQYWSLHPGGANFAYCDGSVHFIAYGADETLAAMATRAGGEVIPD